MTNLEIPASNDEAEKARIYANYDSFSEAVAPLAEKYNSFGYGKIGDDSYVNTGQNRAVFLVAKNDKKYAVKVPRAVRERAHIAEIADEEVEANSRVRGIPGYEQVVAASPEGIIISEYIEGSDMSDITPEDLASVTSGQIDQYICTIIEEYIKAVECQVDPIYREALFAGLDEKISLMRREAFDMEGLLHEREEFRRQYDELRRNFDPTKDAGVDNIF